MCHDCITRVRFEDEYWDCNNDRRRGGKGKRRNFPDRRSERQDRLDDAVGLIAEHVSLSQHSRIRLNQRGISLELVLYVLGYGRDVKGHNGRIITVLGDVETEYWRRVGIDLESARGIHVVRYEMRIITVYRSGTLYRKKSYRSHRGSRRCKD